MLVCAWLALVVIDAVAADLGLGLAAVAAFVAMTYGLIRHRPEHCWTWLAILFAFVLFTIGGVLREQLHTLGNLTPTRSLVPDLVTLPGYFLLAGAYIGWVTTRTQATRNRCGIFIDGGIAGLAMFACIWVFAISPVIGRDQVPLPVRVVVGLYPALSCCLAVTVLQYVFSVGRRWTASEMFYVMAMISMFTGDALYTLAELHLLHCSHTLLDLPYVLAYAAAGSCAFVPSMREMTESRQEPQRDWTPGRIILVGCAFIVPAVLVLHQDPSDWRERTVLFGIVLALTSAGILQLLRALQAAARSEARLTEQALHDHLTGLPNRRYLNRRLGEILDTPRDGEVVALLFLDLDRFKLVNDSMGHSQGDELIVAVAKRLQANVRSDDLVVRVGGDEFLIVLNHVADANAARERANELRHLLSEPFSVLGTDFYVSVSIGVACATPGSPGASGETLISDADTAMYRAKEAGRDTVAVFEDSMRAEIATRVDIERDLHRAIVRNELHVVYQPVVDAGAQRVLAVEALVRWSHPDYGVIQPRQFIPIAEESNLIVEIGGWVLEEALAQVAILRLRPGLANLEVSVNLSAVQLRDELVIERIRHALAEHGLPGSALCLELTESVIMRDFDAALSVFESLRALDVKLAIDDFGIEYSSLAYLQRIPVDRLKIDKSFVDDIDDPDTSSESLVAAIVAVSEALGISTIAEGVARREQADRLRGLGCTALQGYLFSHPVRADLLPDVVELLGAVPREHRRPAPIAATGT